MTLFPLPVREMSEIIAEWGGRFIFDGAHQAGLIAGGQFQDPLNEGAVILTGSAGKTFSGPQSGMILWNDPEPDKADRGHHFPGAGSHPPGQPCGCAGGIRSGDDRVRKILHGADREEFEGAWQSFG